MPTGIEIAQAATLLPIARSVGWLAIPWEALDPHGLTHGRIELDWLAGLAWRPDDRLVLVTAISPTPAGEGKTTTTVDLGDALNRIGLRAMACLREPTLVFGKRVQGGAGAKALAHVVELQADGWGRLSVWIATPPALPCAGATLLGAPSGQVVDIREVRLAAGAGFVAMVGGDVMTRPGLPKVSSAARNDGTDGGCIMGLFRLLEGKLPRLRDERLVTKKDAALQAQLPALRISRRSDERCVAGGGCLPVFLVSEIPAEHVTQRPRGVEPGRGAVLAGQRAVARPSPFVWRLRESGAQRVEFHVATELEQIRVGLHENGVYSDSGTGVRPCHVAD